MVQLSVDARVRGLFLQNPEKAATIFADEFRKFLDEATSFTLRRVVIGTPVFSGTLRGSMFREIRGRAMQQYGVVATPLHYARPIETGGFPPKYPNIGNLADWVRLKLGITEPEDIDRVTFLIARAIKSRAGFKKAHWMFRNAFKAIYLKAQGMLDKAANRVIQRWS